MFEINSKLKKKKKCLLQNCSTTNIKDFIALFVGPIQARSQRGGEVGDRALLGPNVDEKIYCKNT